MRPLFSNREYAGKLLGAALERYRTEDCLVLALPRGGVPVAAEIAAVLHAPLDILLVRKIGVPQYPELAMGAVVDGGAPVIVRNEEVIRETGTSEEAFNTVCARELKEIERRREIFQRGRPAQNPKDRVVIVVDDGIATGATMRAALQAVRMRQPKKLIMAAPVAARDTLQSLSDQADETVCLASPEMFGAVGYYYADFAQVDDSEVVELLSRNCAPSRSRMSSMGDTKALS